MALRYDDVRAGPVAADSTGTGFPAAGRPEPTAAARRGFHLEARPDLRWRVIPTVEVRQCRRISMVGGQPVRCGQRGVAEIARERPRSRAQTEWWAYCPDHLYGRWIEGESVMVWLAVRDPCPAGEHTTP